MKEIFDKCHELSRERGDDIAIFNQFEEYGNYLWHYEVTGEAILAVAEPLLGPARAPRRVRQRHGLRGHHRRGRLARSRRTPG